MRHDLAARYREERLPRYTSYPTAAKFCEAVSRVTYEEWLASLPKDITASLYVHIPFCRSMCWYCACHTTITRREAPVVDYLAALRREIELVVERLDHALPVRHVHLGGGTPSIMAPTAFLSLVRVLNERYSFEPGVEIAVEIDPRTLSSAMVAALGEAGVTRVSLGVQSFDPAVQRAVNRVQSFEQTAVATERLRAAGVDGVNLDLIYGLPHQTLESCLETVHQCLQLRPERFSVFGYAHVPGFKKHQRRIDEAALPDGTGRHAQAAAIAAALTEAGYKPIGLDHYVLPEDPMMKAQLAGRLRRNFQGYTTDQSDVLIGFGASAIGRLPQGYAQNEVAIGRYVERIARGELATARGYALTLDDRLRAELIERLMCDFRVDVEKMCRKHGARPEALVQGNPRLLALAADGLVQLEGSVVRVADHARFLVRSVAAAFDAYLGSSGRPYSRAV